MLTENTINACCGQKFCEIKLTECRTRLLFADPDQSKIPEFKAGVGSGTGIPDRNRFFSLISGPGLTSGNPFFISYHLYKIYLY